MTSQEPKNSHHVDPAGPTEVIAVPAPAPVFVDSTGRRSRFLRRLALAFGVLLLGYGGLISVSLAGGPVSMSAVLPLPGLDDSDDEEKPAPQPKTTPTPAPAPTTAPARQIVESVERDDTERRRPAATASSRKPSTKPSKSVSPSPSKSTSPSPVASKPVESGTVSQPPKPNPGTSTSTPPVVVDPVPPAGDTKGGTGGGLPVAPVPPPVVEEITGDSGGSGGGGPAPADRPGPVGTDAPAPAPPPVDADPADRAGSAAPSTRAAP